MLTVIKAISELIHQYYYDQQKQQQQYHDLSLLKDDEGNNFRTVLTLWWRLLSAWLFLEGCFYILYLVYLVPRANQRTDFMPFLNRTYADVDKRHRIFLLILKRMHAFARLECQKNDDEREFNTIFRRRMAEFFDGWFHRPGFVPSVAPNVPSHILDNLPEHCDTDETEKVSLPMAYAPKRVSGTSYTQQTSIASTATSASTSCSDSGGSSSDVEHYDEVDDDEGNFDSNVSNPFAGTDSKNNAKNLNDNDDSSSYGDWIPIAPITSCENDICTVTTSSSPTVTTETSTKTRTIILNQSSTASTNSTDLLTSSTSTSWTMPDISKYDMDEFLAWGLFGRSYSEMDEQELKELQVCYDKAYESLDVVFYPICTKFVANHKNDAKAPPASNKIFRKPRRLNLENTCSIHRPLLWYIGIEVFKLLGGVFLRLIGFQRVRSQQTGLTGWYRSAKAEGKSFNTSSSVCSSDTAILFFHGIAPGGLMPYLPMLLLGILRNQHRKPIFFFDNPNISNTLFTYTALSEQQTCLGVDEILQSCLNDDDKGDKTLETKPTQNLCLMGHSFGSCQISWIVHSPLFTNRISKIILMDPVSILLSEPDVMVNFLYSYEATAVRMLASSELFTEHYLRRHFAWYNSELWIEEDILTSSHTLLTPSTDTIDQQKVHKNIKVLIALSEKDAIVNAPKVKQHIDILVSEKQQRTKQQAHDEKNSSIHLIYWKGADHADCVRQPKMWSDLREKIDNLFVTTPYNSNDIKDKNV